MFSNYDYDIIIIGGGISGLFLTYKLSDTNLKIILIESSDRLGGRVKTIQKDGLSFEGGAARFHSSHSKLITLINELNLGEDIIKLPEEISYRLAKKSKISIDTLLKESFQRKKDYQIDFLKNITYFQYLITIFDFDTAEFIKESFGYDSEFIHLNAHAALTMFENDFFKDNDYFILKNGLSSIINELQRILELKENIIIKKNCTVIDIDDTKIITDKTDYFYYDHLICALPQKSLLSFEYFKKNDIQNLLTSVHPTPLLRIYAKYPTKNLWFKKIKRTITNNYIRHIIPINYDTGLIMISYTDDIYAKLWDKYNTTSKLNSLDDQLLIQALHKEIKEIFNIDPPNPDFISQIYWNEGVHFWKTGYDLNEISNKIIKPLESKEIYICGEAFSKKQGWIEGALDTCYNVLQTLPLDFRIVTDQKFCEIAEEIFTIIHKDIKDDKDDKDDKDNKDDIDDKGDKDDKDDKDDIDGKKKYKIDDVLKKNEGGKEWIIMEVNDEKVIYDISKWIPEHPGGSVIYRAIEANDFYSKSLKTKSEQSPTQLFMGNPIHKMEDSNGRSVFQRFFIDGNDMIQRVGVLNS